jgi:hypothetical protein
MPEPKIAIGPGPGGPKLPNQFPGKPDDPSKPGKRPAKGDPAYNPDVNHPPKDPVRPLPQR